MYWYLTNKKAKLNQLVAGVVNVVSVVLLFGIFAVIFSSTNAEIQASDVDIPAGESENSETETVYDPARDESIAEEDLEENSDLSPDGESSANTNLVTDYIFERSEFQEEIAEVKRSLNGQLAEYRTAEQEFGILRGQFSQLNTLSSLEAAVQATRNVMEIRATVLRTYLTLLRLELLNTTGVKLEYREYSLDEIERLDTALIRHIDQTRLSLDRDAIRQTADDFVPLAEEIQEHISFTRQVLQLGRYQAVYDSTSSLIATIQKQSENPESDNAIIITPQDERALGQVLNRLDGVNETLVEADVVVTEAMLPDARNRSVQIEKNISTAYAELRQVYRFLDELLQNYR